MYICEREKIVPVSDIFRNDFSRENALSVGLEIETP